MDSFGSVGGTLYLFQMTGSAPEAQAVPLPRTRTGSDLDQVAQLYADSAIKHTMFVFLVPSTALFSAFSLQDGHATQRSLELLTQHVAFLSLSNE